MQVALHPEQPMAFHGEIGTQPNEVSLEEVLHVLRGWRWPAITFVILATIAAGALAHLSPKTYQATVVMAAQSSAPDGGRLGGLGSLGSEFGGLASLAGISLSGDSKKWEYVAVLQSAELTEKYIQNNNLFPILFSQDWDTHASRWKVDSPQRVPTLWKANQIFAKKIRTVTVDNKTGLIHLTISWRNPKLAADWANGLVELTNEYLRTKAIKESERDIAYLNDQAAKTTVVEAKRAIYSLLEAELDKAMIARGNDEYAFKVLDPAQAPERPSSLPASVWAAIALLGSLLIAVLSAFLVANWRKSQPVV